jgi:hypothetical protein
VLEKATVSLISTRYGGRVVKSGKRASDKDTAGVVVSFDALFNRGAEATEVGTVSNPTTGFG